MKQYIYILLLPCLIFAFSCKKGFLDVEDNSNLNRQSYVKDLNSLKEYSKGIYLMLSTKYEIGIDVAYPGLISDELKISSLNRPLAIHNNWSQIASDIQIGNISAASTTMNGTWLNLYNIIRSCNFIINNADKYVSENPIQANDIKGQALALRALLHLKLVNIFSQHYTFTQNASHLGIPYIKTEDISKPYNRQSVYEVYQNMITDLKTSISLMAATIADTRYMNQSAAKAILARIYLYMEDFENAKKLSIELTNQHPLLTIAAGYPTDLFKLKSPQQTEVLFQITPIYQDNAISEFIGIFLAIKYYKATADIGNILKLNTNDIRNTWVTEDWVVTKFPSGVAGGLGYDPLVDYYSPIVRSSEMFLIAAEASAKTNEEGNARIYLNAIRKRADPTLSDITPSGTSLLDSIYKERRRELCFEGFRMWDLQRWKLGVQRTDVFSGYQTTLPYPSDKAVSPIPGQDVKLMGLQQNPSYY